MIKRAFLFIFLISSLYFDCLSQEKCGALSKCFISGETINYQIFYNVGFIWINAGNVNCRVKSTNFNGHPVYQLSAIGKTRKSFDSFFTVRDTLISYVDSSAIVPFKAMKCSHEGNWTGLDYFTFENIDSGWRVTTRLKRKGIWKEPVVDLTTECGFDILTTVYRLRCILNSEQLKIGQKRTIPLRLDDGEYKVYMTYLGKERVKLHGNGTYPAQLFQLTLVESKQFKRGDALRLWLSDDGNRIPLLIETPIRVGNVKAVFSNADKTLFPLGKSLTE